jgi:hypothetical protein
MTLDRISTYVPLGLIGLLCACAASPERPLSLQERPGREANETATAQDAEQIAGEVDSVAPSSGTDDETICRTEVVTGTHRPTTICLTRAERRAMRDAAQDWYRSGGRQGAVSQIPVVR